MEPCETRGAMGLASSASQSSVAAAMVLSYLITRGSKNRKNRGALLPRRHHFERGAKGREGHGDDDDADIPLMERCFQMLSDAAQERWNAFC